jgi:hypothetical protein
MAKTRPDGTPLTPDDLEHWNQPYVYQEFPKMLYRRRRSGIGRRPASETRAPEGTTKIANGIVLEYLTVQSAAEAIEAATEGWTELATVIAGITSLDKRSTTEAHRRREAEDALVPAVREALAVEALEELRKLPRPPTVEALADWAARHTLEAPCLVAAAGQFWQGGRGVVHRIPNLPTWDQRLEELARLPPTWGPYIAGESLATAEEAHILKQDDLKPLEACRLTLQAGLPKTADELLALEAEIARVHRFWDEDMPRRRAENSHVFTPTRSGPRSSIRYWIPAGS